MSTLPTFTKLIDDAFLHTWYTIRTEAVDNILQSLVVWEALRQRGCFKSQVGGDTITRTIRYAVPAAENVVKGQTVEYLVTEQETMARWGWRYIHAGIQRSTIEDQQNSGKDKIKDYVATRLQGAKDSISQKMETDLDRAIVTDETGTAMQGLNDLLPPYASRATGTYGLIARSNSWWQAQYKAVTVPTEVNLIDDMKNLYNTVGANNAPPKLLIFTQAMFELYEGFGLDASQIVKSEGGLADLGFDVLKFKGKDCIWTPNQTAGTIKFLNTDYIEVVYDPKLWFAMSHWKDVPRQLERVADILSACTVIGTQPRRNGLLYTA